MKSLSTRERVYIIVFAVTLVWGVWNYRGLFTGDKASAVPTPAPVKALVPAATAMSTTVQLAGFTTTAPYVAPRWNRDPFHRRWRDVRANTAPLQTETKKHAELRLSAVVIRPDIRYAVINGQILKEGESFEGRTLIRILATGVIMDDNGREVSLDL